jgi:iduronate 2-sulfatase
MVNEDITDPIGPVYLYAYVQNSEIATYGGFQHGLPQQLIPSSDVRVAAYHGYYAATALADAQVGRVMAAFHQRKRSEVDNTIIIFTADHGCFLGSKSMYAKHNVYEEAARVPLIIIPPVFDPENQYTNSLGKTSYTPIEMLDLYPTIMEMAGIGTAANYSMIDGVSMISILENPLTSPGLKRFMITQNPANTPGIMSYSFRTWNYWYVIHIQGDTTGGSIIGRELYNYQTDPREIDNLISNPVYADVAYIFPTDIDSYMSLRWTGINGLGPFNAPIN